MKKHIKIIKWIALIIITAIPSIVFADNIFDTTGGGPLWDMFSKLSFTPPPGDLSIAYLGKLFGHVPGVPQLANSGYSLLGAIFYVFNTGILGISGVFLSYTTFKVVTETTMDGSAMGKGSTIWTAIRVSISTGLLVPQATGYSLINGIVMWVVIQSVGLADMTWSSAMEYLKRGNTLTAPKAEKIIDYHLISYTMDVPTGRSEAGEATTSNPGSADVLRSLVCAHTIKNSLDRYQDNREPQSNPDVTSGRVSEFKTYAKDKANRFVFPSIKGEKVTGSSVAPFSNYKIPITSTISGVCGKIGYGLDSDADYSDALKTKYLNAKKTALLTMIQALDPVAKRIVNKVKPEKGKRDPEKLATNYVLYKDGDTTWYFADPQTSFSPTDLRYTQDSTAPTESINWPSEALSMLNSAVNYQLSLQSIREEATTQTDDNNDAKYAQAKENGWIMAGAYYDLLTQIADAKLLDKKSYQLQGFTKDNKQGLVNFPDRNTAPYMSIFSISDIDGIFEALYPPTPPGSTTEDSDTLKLALEWVFYSTPYAKLLSLSMVNADDQDSTWQDLGTDWMKEGFIWVIHAQVMAGAVALALPSGIGAIAGAAALTAAPWEYLFYAVGMVNNTWLNVMGPSSSTKDPMIKLKTLGNEMMKQSMGYFANMNYFFVTTTLVPIAASVMYSGIKAAAAPFTFMGTSVGVIDAAQDQISTLENRFEMTRTIMYTQLPMGMAVTGPMFVTGATLAIYVPLIPYMLFLFGVISWLISVLVLMAAAPIICFLMLWGSASQENPLLSREAEQFVMQMIAVFFRPTLMVIGLIAGMVLLYIGVDLLNAGFGQVITSTGIASSKGVGVFNLSKWGVYIAKQIGLTVIYTFIMVSLVNMCFSTIHLLYSEAMRIASIQVSAAGMEEKAMGEVKGASTQVAEAGAGGMKESSTSSKGIGQAKLKDKKKKTGGAEGDKQSPPTPPPSTNRGL